MEQEKIKLELRGIDFKDTDFMDNSDCAISRAIKRQLGIRYVGTSLSLTFIENVCYHFDVFYSQTKFTQDEQQAASNGYSKDEVIRTLTLTKLKN